MSNTEMNRQIVQEGLERKKTVRIQRMTDAAHDAAERSVRAIINRHADTAQATAQAAEQAARAARAEQERHAARKAKQRLKKDQWIKFVCRSFGGLAIAAALAFLYSIGWVHIALAIAGLVIATANSLVNFVAYLTRNKTAFFCKVDKELSEPQQKEPQRT